MDIDRLPIPNVGNNIFYKEFSIGAMLPQIGLSGKGVSPGHEYDGVGVITVSDNINIDEEDIDDDSLLKSFTEAKRTLVSVIEEKKRSQLPDSSFGIPEDRKYPLDTKKHVESAIRLFSHAEKSKKKELAKRIKVKADEYNIEIPETTQCYKYLQESYDDNYKISYSKSFDDVKDIVNSLSKTDLNRICNGTFKNSPHVLYREVLLMDNKPASFIDVYKLPDTKEDGVIVVATKPENRGMGFGSILVNRMKSKLKGKNLVWKTQKDNKTSIHLANKMNFNPVIEESYDDCIMLTTESEKNIFAPTDDEHKLFRKYLVYKKQFDSGKISKAEYDKKLKDDNIPIKLFERELEKYKKAETRPNGKGKVIERREVSGRQAVVVVDKLEAEKVKRWYNICKTTDDYKEYKTYFNNICMFFKIPNTYVLGGVTDAPHENDRQLILTFLKKSRDIDTSNKKLYHTSNVNNITRLNGSFRSKDGRFLFPEKRIYFGIDNAVKRSVSDKDEMAKYTYKPKSKINNLSHANDYATLDNSAGFIRAEHLDVDKVKTEACKDVQTARKFVSDVEKLAKKYNANYFIVTDGASGVHNQGEPAVKFHRDKQIEWETKNGFDPDDGWRNNPDDMTGYKLQTESQIDETGLESLDIKTPKELSRWMRKSINISESSTKSNNKDRFEYLEVRGHNLDKYLIQRSYFKEYLDFHIKDTVGEIVIDKENDKLAGYVFVYKKGHKYAGLITPIVVIKKYRGLGLSNKLLEDAIHKYGAIDLVVSRNNKPAMHLYKKYGFVPIGYGNKGSSEYWMKLKSKLTKDDKIIKESEENYMNAETLVTDLMESFIEERANSSKGGDPDIPDSIEPVVDTLESKGYMVKYSSPGYANTRFDNDKNKDGIINAKLVSTARIIFSRDYNFSKTPQGWEWKVMNNGAKALYAKQYTYNEKMGTKKEAFQKWKAKYMQSIKDWAASLPQVGTKDPDPTPDENFNSNKR